MTPGERKERLDLIVGLQNRVKMQILAEFEAISGYKP